MRWADCTYCGESAHHYDHVPPVCLTMKRGRRTRTGIDRQKTVPSCCECNALLGSHYLLTIAERAAYIAEVLDYRYAAMLDSPTWTEEELQDIHGFVRSVVKSSQACRKRVLDRIEHATTISQYELQVEDVWKAYDKGKHLLEFLLDCDLQELA